MAFNKSFSSNFMLWSVPFAFICFLPIWMLVNQIKPPPSWHGKRVTVISPETPVYENSGETDELQVGESFTVIDEIDNQIYLSTDGGGWVQKKNLKLYDNAMPHLDQQINESPTAENFYNRGLTKYFRDEYQGALDDFDAAIEIDSSNALAYYYRALVWNDLDNLDNAIQDFDQSISRMPEQPLAFYFRAKCWYKKDEIKKAIADFTESIRLAPEDTDAIFDRGYCYLQIDEFDLAIADFSDVISLDDQHVSSHYCRGYAYMMNSDTSSALMDFEQAIQLDPNDYNAYAQRSRIYIAEGEWQKALIDLNRVLELEPDMEGIFYRRAKLNQSFGHFGAAIKDFSLAIEEENAPISWTNDLAWLLATCPEEENRHGFQAIGLATKACSSTGWKNAVFLDTLAAAYASTNQFDLAVKYQKQAIDLIDKKRKPEFRKRLKLYESKKPFIDWPKSIPRGNRPNSVNN